MVAEAALLTPLGWVASPLIKMLFDKAHHHLGTGMDKKMKILQATVLPRLSLAIEKAEKSPNKEKLVDWLNRLKVAYYEAEDAIDLFEYELLKQKVKGGRKTLEQKGKNERGTRISLPSQFVHRPLKIASVKLKDSLSIFSRQKIMLKGSINKLMEIAKEANGFRDLLDQENASCSDAQRDTSGMPPISVFGREKDKNDIVYLLTKKTFNSRPVIPIIAIMGRSGVGKTTLAQYVYKHMVGQKHFDLCVWVHAPRKFEATDVIKSMIENIEANEHTPNNDPSKNLQPLSSQIGRMVGSKKLLLLLDDFWSDTEDIVDQWEKFIGCLSSCLPESRIVLTTQSKNATQQAGLGRISEVETYNLEEIEEGQFSELFMHYAWPSNTHLPKEEFERIGQKISFKLKGDPGAAKLVGHQLSSKLDLRYWEEVAEKDWLGDNMKARIWSYQQLPHDIQRCFAIWGLFSKGYWFSRNTLINLWMAEGFIRPIEKHERLEDIGENYLDELVSRFFIEEVEVEERKRYQLHDLLHDLAEQVQGDDFIRIDSTNSREISSHISNMLSRSENIRHIYLQANMINEVKEKLCLMHNIRTFWVEPDSGIVPKNVLKKILKHLAKLRVLYLSKCVDDLPLKKFCRNLKLLRYIDIHGAQPLKKFPDSICKLYHLQRLDLPNCESLPKDFCELLNLRWFYTSMETMSHISHVGRLTSLQELNNFVVRKECGYELHQLENLNQLRGKMRISGLENVASTEDAVKANMRKKKNLTALEFDWNSDERDTNNATRHSTPHVELLDALQPHPRISDLTLKGFGGDRFPNWLLSQNSLEHLRSLILMGFKNLKKMPAFPPNLNSLEISNIPQPSYFSEDDFLKKEERNQSKHEAVKQIVVCLKPEDVQLPSGFESNVKDFFVFVTHRLEAALYDSPDLLSDECLKILTLDDPWNEDYSREQLLDVWVKFMHCHMETMFYKNEESKLVLPSSLTYLKISSCSITDDALSTCIQCLVSLSKLKLSFIHTVTSLPPKEVLCSLKHLKSLTIEGCYLLSSLGGIGALTSLIELELVKCPNLNISDASLPASLERLIFRYCSKADVINAFNVSHVIRALNVGNLSLLMELDLMGWGGHLEGLNLLTSLCKLLILDCLEINLSSPMGFALQDVSVDDLKLLKLILSNETIFSLDTLSIFGIQGDFPDDGVSQSLTSVKHLSFYDCETALLPKNLKNLASVQFLTLEYCPNLRKLEELPRNLHYLAIENCPELRELEELPKNLNQLDIKDCPTLTEKFKKGGPNFQVWFDEGYTILTFSTEERRGTFERWTH